MSGDIILHTMLNSALITILLFGAYLIFRQLQSSKIKWLFLIVLFNWSSALLFDSYDAITRSEVGADIASPLNYNALLSGVVSQPFMLFLFYNLLFSMRASIKIVAVNIALLLSVFIGIWVYDYYSEASCYDLYLSMEEFYADFGSPMMLLKSTVVVMQLTLSISCVVISKRLVPIYQNYIEQSESNAVYNLLWINEISRILLVVTIVYTIDIVMLTYTSATIYYIVVIVAFVRMIDIFLRFRTLENFDNIYSQLGIKWSFRRMWYVDETKQSDIINSERQFKQINDWILSNKRYSNPDFSFKDIDAQFRNITYNDFDAMLRQNYGQNFQSYIRECRVNEAAKLIESCSGALHLKEIAFKVGFENNSSFSRAFKAVKGVPASEWIKQSH